LGVFAEEVGGVALLAKRRFALRLRTLLRFALLGAACPGASVETGDRSLVVAPTLDELFDRQGGRALGRGRGPRARRPRPSQPSPIGALETVGRGCEADEHSGAVRELDLVANRDFELVARLRLDRAGIAGLDVAQPALDQALVAAPPPQETCEPAPRPRRRRSRRRGGLHRHPAAVRIAGRSLELLVPHPPRPDTPRTEPARR